MPAIVLSHAARRDFDEILLWSVDRFGANAARRYRALLFQAIRDLAEDPQRPGSRERPEISPEARTYHLVFSRCRVGGERVRNPRHFLLYRVREGKVEIARILHEDRDLPRHVPQDFREE